MGSRDNFTDFSLGRYTSSMDPSDKDRPRWMPIFDRISEDKRQRVLYSAKRAFADKGFTGANVNEIARDAGISVGALYKYFRSKDDIFLAIIDASRDLIEDTLDSILESESGFYGRVEAVLRAAAESSAADPDMVRIYIACTTQEVSPLSAELARKIETASSARYTAMVAEARSKGEIRTDLDDAAAALCLDNLFLSVQFAFGSPYYMARLKLFLGEDTGSGPIESEGIVASILKFIRAAFGG
jgi:TetR/AcrR family transcriptional regulator